MKKGIEKLKHNPALMMILCCGIPLVILFVAVYYFGLSRGYLLWGVLLLCLLSHYFMMKHMHGDKKLEGDKQ